jgi:formamidopyrimidine-DNA glycosylase
MTSGGIHSVPELPEVQTVVDNLNTLGIGGSIITKASVHWPRTVAPVTPAKFRKQIRGLRIDAFSRRGKYIVVSLSRGWTLLIHLRMTGRLKWEATGSPRCKHEHVVLQLDQTNELRFHDTRKFGRLFLTQTPETVLVKIGPEPLEKSFTRKRLRHMLQGRRRQMKPLLLDQTFIAGLGNIYVDEALWSARIHPLRISSSLKEKEIAALHKAVRLVLRRGLKNMGTSLGTGRGNFYSVAGRKGRNADELKVFRRTGDACPRCKTVIERLNVAQRGTHICPVCQPAPKAPQRRG